MTCRHPMVELAKWIAVALIACAPIMLPKATAHGAEPPANPGSISAEDWSLVPPVLRPDKTEAFLERDNARDRLFRVLELLRPIANEQLDDQVYELARGEIRLSDDARRWAQQHVDSNRAALDALPGVLERRFMRFENDRQAMDAVMGLTRLSKVLLLAAVLEVDAQHYDQAAHFAKQTSLLAALVCRDPNYPTVHLRGLTMQIESCRLMSTMAADQRVPASLVASMLETGASFDGANRARGSLLRAEFIQHVLPTLVRLPQNHRLEEAIASQLQMMRPEKPVDLEGFDINRELNARGDQIEKLLNGHANPISRSATIRLAADRYVAALEDQRTAAAVRKASAPDFAEEVVAWPEELSLHVLDLLSLVLGNEQPEIGAEIIAAAQNKLTHVENPLGKHIAAQFDPRKTQVATLHLMADLHCRLTALALQAHFRRAGQLPGSLAALSRGDRPPFYLRDPFGDQLRYSPQKRLVWSIGPNGQDDEGVNEPRDSNFLRKLASRGADESAVDEQSTAARRDDRAVSFQLPHAAD